MVEKILKCMGIRLRVGDWVYYVIVLLFFGVKVIDRVEGFVEVIEKDLMYDRVYYLEFIFKECKKLLRVLVDLVMFREWFLFSECVCIMKYMLDGDKIIVKEKNELKKKFDKIVESVVLWGCEIEFDNSLKFFSVFLDEY